MGASPAGRVVLIRFPFSDLSRAKLRPALVLAEAPHNDRILCQITSNPYSDLTAIEVLEGDFVYGGLHRSSYARPGKLFTADLNLIVAEVGALRKTLTEHIVSSLIEMLRGKERTEAHSS
jgi:mRNA interferase MazF